MWLSANEEGIIFPFITKKDKEFPHYLSEYSDNKRFQDFILLNDRLKISAAENSKAEYFVNLPVNFNPDNKYPLIIILHGGIGNNYATYINWDSKKIKNSYISVYPQGRIARGSYARSYGESGLEDIENEDTLFESALEVAPKLSDMDNITCTEEIYNISYMYKD